MKSVKATVALALMLLLATGLIACKKAEEVPPAVDTAVPAVEQPAAPVAPAPEAAAPAAPEAAAPEAAAPAAAPEAAPAK